MHLHELFCNTQAKSQPSLAKAEIARRMAAGVELREEWLEQMPQLPRFQADAAIVDLNLRVLRPRLDRAASSIVPPSGVNLIALVSRLIKTALTLSASISNVPRSSASSSGAGSAAHE